MFDMFQCFTSSIAKWSLFIRNEYRLQKGAGLYIDTIFDQRTINILSVLRNKEWQSITY